MQQKSFAECYNVQKPAHTPTWQTLQFISFSGSISHFVILVNLRCELTYLSSPSSNNSAHVSNRLVSRDKKQTLLLDERASKKIKITNEIIIPFEKLSFGNLVFFFLQRLKSSQAHFPKWRGISDFNRLIRLQAWAG